MGKTKTIGWAWVAVQAVLIIALIALPNGDDWSLPGWLSSVAFVANIVGLLLAIGGCLGLGGSLTPNPVPSEAGELRTQGFYKYMRHPIYTGVLLVVIGIALRSQSWIHAILAIATVVFFDRKAAWEEIQLADHYRGYTKYAAKTPKFIPFTKPS